MWTYLVGLFISIFGFSNSEPVKVNLPEKPQAAFAVEEVGFIDDESESEEDEPTEN